MTASTWWGMLAAGVEMQRWWALPTLMMLGACVARPPSSAEDAGVVDAGVVDAGVVDAGVVDDEPTAGEPFGRCRITPDCRVGFCTEGRCLPPVQPGFSPNGKLCRDDGFDLELRATSLDPFIDCREWGARCLPRRGCALPPGARCAIDDERLLPCGAGDVCVDGRCVVDDVGGAADATLLSIPGEAVFQSDGPDDLDCFLVPGLLGRTRVTSTASPLLNSGNGDPITGELASTVHCVDGRTGAGPHTITVDLIIPPPLDGCVDDTTIVDRDGVARTCPADTVCRSLIAGGFGCVPAVGQPCAGLADRCGGFCLRNIDECAPLPTPVPLPRRCSRLDDGRVVYETTTQRGFLCSDRCLDGIGCIDATPTSTCAMWREDPAGGLARCITAEAPAWASDDFPGHYAEAPPVAPGTHTLTSTQAGDVDCVTVMAPARGIVETSTTSGHTVIDGARTLAPIVHVGEHVRVCVEEHEGTATLQVDVTEAP